MSPDDHFSDLKRLIQAANGKAHRVVVISPMLYGSRQHRRNFRESLDCAVALQELQAMGVSNVITFDAHDPRVQNATPLMGFDNVMPTYQAVSYTHLDVYKRQAFSTSSLLMLVLEVMVMCCSFPVAKSFAETLTMPFASMSKVTSI